MGRSPGEGKGYPPQYSGLENSLDYTVHGVTESWTRLSKFHHHSSSFIIDYAKAFDCVDNNKLENSERYGNTRPPDLPRETYMQVRKQQLELDMEQQTGSK